MKMGEIILVLGVSDDGALRNGNFESIASARNMKEEAEGATELLGNDSTQAKVENKIQHGADRAITVEHANLENYTSEGYGQALLEIIEDESPYGIVMGHTAIGKDVAPKIASRLESGLISDAVDV